MASQHECEAQLDMLRKREAELTLEINKARKKAKVASGDHHVAQLLHTAGAKEVMPKLPKPTETKLLFLMEIAEGCADIPTSWALGLGRPAHCKNHGFEAWSDDVRGNISAGVGFLYTGVAYNAVLEVLDGELGEMMKLCRYAVEHQLYHWLVELNCSKGVSPGTNELVVHACKCLPNKAPEAIRAKLKSFFVSGSRQVRKWVASFRKRWGVTKGLLQAGECLEPSDVSRKAAWFNFYYTFVSFFVSSWVQILGSPGDTRNWPLCLILNSRPQNWSRQGGPVFGTPSRLFFTWFLAMLSK